MAIYNDATGVASGFTSRAFLLAVFSIALVLFATTNLPWQLDDYDQAQQAFTSFEIQKEGHWFYQRTPHELIAQKPPLVAWFSVALYEITHSWNVAWRLPSLITAIATAVLLFRGAASAFGRLPAIFAAAAFSFNLLTVRLATLVRTDMPLAFFLFVPGLLIFNKLRTGSAWTTTDRFVFFIALAASMYTKGPFAFVYLLPAVLVFLLLTHGKQRIGGWLPWVGATLLFLVWVAGGILVYPTFLRQVVMFEVVERLGTGVHRAQPVFFYLLHLVHKLMPWSILSVLLGISCLRQKHRDRMSPQTLWLVLWTFTGFIVMSLVPSKRLDRIFPVVPPFCLLLASQVRWAIRTPGFMPRLLRAFPVIIAFALCFTGGYTIWKVTSGYRDHADALVVFSAEVRRQATEHGWRFEVMSGESGSEGMLLYLDKLHFVDADEAASQWQAQAVDALVVPADEADELVAKLPDSMVTPVRSVHRQHEPRVDYVLIVRQAG